MRARPHTNDMKPATLIRGLSARTVLQTTPPLHRHSAPGSRLNLKARQIPTGGGGVPDWPGKEPTRFQHGGRAYMANCPGTRPRNSGAEAAEVRKGLFLGTFWPTQAIYTRGRVHTCRGKGTSSPPPPPGSVHFSLPGSQQCVPLACPPLPKQKPLLTTRTS